ncbi:MAG: aldose 1-epimerase [Phycisphaera sp.]|nr:aldose 1-epimerase [Phycisphaera sp.]
MPFDHCSAREGLPECWMTVGHRSTATVVPSAGMNLVVLSADGEDHLVMPAPLPEFMKTPRTGGVPLLHPWANRLRGDRYRAAGREVDLSDHPRLKRDGSGLPMHGLLLRSDDWIVESSSMIGDDASVIQGSIDWNPESPCFDAFPFAHRLDVRWTVFEGSGAIVSARCDLLVEAGGGPVPLASGWHPYLRPSAGIDRSAIRIDLPRLRQAVLDDRGLPVLDGKGNPRLGPPIDVNGRMGDRVFDDLYRAPDGGWKAGLFGGDSIVEIEADDSWPWLQVYSPAGSDFACIEPMLAPTASLSDGHARILDAGDSFDASFTLRILEGEAS